MHRDQERPLTIRTAAGNAARSDTQLGISERTRATENLILNFNGNFSPEGL